MSYNLNEIVVKLATKLDNSQLVSEFKTGVDAITANAAPRFKALGDKLVQGFNVTPAIEQSIKALERLGSEVKKGKFFEGQLEVANKVLQVAEQTGHVVLQNLANQAKMVVEIGNAVNATKSGYSYNAMQGVPVGQAANTAHAQMGVHYQDPVDAYNAANAVRADAINSAWRGKAAEIGRIEEADRQRRTAAYNRALDPYRPAGRYVQPADPPGHAAYVADMERRRTAFNRGLDPYDGNRSAYMMQNPTDVTMSRVRMHEQRFTDAATARNVAAVADMERRRVAYNRNLDPYADTRTPYIMQNPTDVTMARVRMHERRFDAAYANRAAGGWWQGHNLRFAMQNVGFGIDDAIQSYHYGGAAASIRAASNNITAIAGMSIANPALAAGTVVGLSALTAAVPLIFRSAFKEITPAERGLATASLGGIGVRSVRTHRDYEAEASSTLENIHKFEDQRDAERQKVQAAKAFYQKFGEHPNVHLRAMTSQYSAEEMADRPGAQFSSRMNMTRREALQFDEAMKIVQEYEDSGRGETTDLDIGLHRTKLKKILTSAERYAGQADLFDEKYRRIAGEGYRAGSLSDYEDTIKQRYKTELDEISASGMKPKEKADAKIAAEIRFTQAMARKTENANTVARNFAERGMFEMQQVIATGMGSVYGGITMAARGRSNTYEEMYRGGLMTAGELANYQDKNTAGIKLQRANAFNDEQYGILGISSGVGALSERYRRANQKYLNDLLLSNSDRTALMASSAAGEKFHMTQAMEEANRMHAGYTSPFGTLRSAYEKREFDYTNDPFLDPMRRMQLLAGNKAGFMAKRADMIIDYMDASRVNNDIGMVHTSFSKQFRQLKEEFTTGELKPGEQEEKLKLVKQQYVNEVRKANIPHGQEKFISDAQDVGSAADKSMRMQLLGNFGVADKQTDIMQKSLDQLIIQTDQQAKIESALTLAKLEIPN